MYSDTGDTTSLVPGFPIRTSSDQRSVDSSPRLIAASHVLHRPLMPRHPPCALKHLQTQKPIDIEKIEITPQQPTNTSRPSPLPPSEKGRSHESPSPPRVDARNHYPRIKHHTPPPKPGATTHLHPRRSRRTGLLSQSPIVCPVAMGAHAPTKFIACTRTAPTTGERPIQRIAQNTEPPHAVGGPESRGAP